MRLAFLTRLVLAAALTVPSTTAPVLAGSEHQSVLRIEAFDGAPITRHVKLGLNKSMLVEIPGEIRDVVVSNPKILDAVAHSNNRTYLIGMGVGEANAFFFDRNGQQILTLEVQIDRDLSAISDLMARLIPGSRVHVEAINDNIVLTGSVINPADASRAADIASRFVKDKENVLNMIAAESNEQVMLKVSVVEMNRNIVKQLGVDTVAAGKAAGAFTNPFGLLDPESLVQIGSALRFPVNDLPPPTIVQGAFTTKGVTIGSVLRALEQNGLVNTLAEPNITAISGETANFLAGGEFPVPVSGGNAGQLLDSITVEFKKFGVSLAFTPLVLSEGRINLKVSTEVSELSSDGAVILNNFRIPALKVRRASTTMEMPSGGSLVMAGLLSETTKQAIGGYPGLKNLPVLGTLFRSRDFLKSETELVIFITPYVVNPVAKNQLIRPDKGFAQSTDEQAYLFGRLNRIYGREPEDIAVGSVKDAPSTEASPAFIVD